MVTLAEASRSTGIPIATLRSAVRDGRLTGRKFGRDWVIEDDQKWKEYLTKYKKKSAPTNTSG